MINFFPPNSIKRVEINKENISARGMKVNPLLYVVAKKYEEDWEKLYQKSETDLALEKETVEQQSLILKTQENNIKQKEEHILKLGSNILQKEADLKQKQENLNKLQNYILEKNKLVTITSATLKRQEIELLKHQIEITSTQKLLKEQIAEFEIQKSKIDIQKEEIASQQGLIDSQKSSLNKSIADLKKQQLVLYFVLVALLLFGLMIVAIFRSYKIKKKANKVLNAKNIEISKQNTEIIQQKEEIETQRDEIEAQRDFLARQRDQILTQNKDITDSITYASKIQHALLPPELLTTQLFKDLFVFYLPRDIVSGDFYWTRKKGDIIYIAVADCTGHGVPGAFMSMLGVAFLNEILDRYNKLSAGSLLDNLREKVVYSLHQTENEGGSKDGMDISIVAYNEKTKIAEIAGANNAVYLVRKNELTEFKPDKMPIGIYYGDEKPFTSNTIKVEKGDFFYMFSDGYPDQFGGEKGKKFKYKALKNLCLNLSKLSSIEQEKEIENTFVSWKKHYNQVDDILFLGIRFE
jgi:serine phosphatase RsbU (regulator of sigma subunit)